MNENLDLCKILEGCEGIELYSTVYGTVIFQGIVNHQIKLLHHRLNAGDGVVYYELNGHLNSTIADDEVTLFPSKSQRNWKYFVKPIPFGAPMMCRNKNISWMLSGYAGKLKNGRHFVKHKEFGKVFDDDYEYMIPFDKFDPCNIEESLKYNIQK